jgi:hypothetical protein
MLDPEDFDKERPLVLARAGQVNGHQLEQGEALSVVDDESEQRGELTAEQAARLWSGGRVVYADRALPTPVESPEAYAERTTEVDDLGKGKFLIRAPWLSEAVTVSADSVAERRAEIVSGGVERHRLLIDRVGPEAAAAVVTGADGFSLDDKGNGNFEIAGPGLDEPLKVRGRANAEEKLDELRTAAAVSAAETAGPTATGGSAEVPVTAGDQGGSPITDAATGAGGLTDAAGTGAGDAAAPAD